MRLHVGRRDSTWRINEARLRKALGHGTSLYDRRANLRGYQDYGVEDQEGTNPKTSHCLGVSHIASRHGSHRPINRKVRPMLPVVPMVSQIVKSSSFAPRLPFDPILLAHPETACANTFAASSLSSFALSACGNSYSTPVSQTFPQHPT